MSYKLKITSGSKRTSLPCYSRQEAQTFIERFERHHELLCLRAVAKAKASRKGSRHALAYAPARPTFKLLKVPTSR